MSALISISTTPTQTSTHHLWNPALKVNPDNQNMTIGDYSLGVNLLKLRNIDQ